MKTIHEAANAVEAHMLADLLKQEGLSPHIRGEHLQGLSESFQPQTDSDDGDYDRVVRCRGVAQ